MLWLAWVYTSMTLINTWYKNNVVYLRKLKLSAIEVNVDVVQGNYLVWLLVVYPPDGTISPLNTFLNPKVNRYTHVKRKKRFGQIHVESEWNVTHWYFCLWNYLFISEWLFHFYLSFNCSFTGTYARLHYVMTISTCNKIDNKNYIQMKTDKKKITYSKYVL